jgi:hypothetical protein
MSDQFELFKDNSKSIEEKFQEFHAGNLWVYQRLVEMARILKERGQNKFGIKMLYEVIRWKYLSESTYDVNSSFKLSNNYHSRYARLIMEQEADLKDCFNIRGLRS